MSPIQLRGKCLCEKVQISLVVNEASFDVCHCGMCRRWGGGPALTLEAQDQVTLHGEEWVSRYDSSAWAERAFCKSCGTHLFFRLKRTGYQNFSLGLFPEASGFRMKRQIYIDAKPDQYAFANLTEKLTEAQVLQAVKE